KIDRQLGTPIVRNMLQCDRPAHFKGVDLVRTATERWICCRSLEIASLPIVFRKYGELTHDRRQLPVAAGGEREFYLSLTDLFGLRHVGIVGPEERSALLLQDVQREDHVIDRDRLAIVPSRSLAQVESDPRLVRCDFDRFSDEAVFGFSIVI